ncbi:transcriptional repressor [Lebetimonas sp. JS138]
MNIGIATVYRTLAMLEENSLIKKFEIPKSKKK